MKRALARVLFSCLGSLFGAGLVSLVEGREAVREAAARGATYAAVFGADFALLVPVALVVGLLVGVLFLYLQPSAPRAPSEIVAAVRAVPVLARSRTAALAPLVVLGSFGATVAAAHVARLLLESGKARPVGVELAASSAGILLLSAAVVLALLSPLRRGLARGADRFPRLVDPPTTFGVALVAVCAALAVGAHTGDAGGDGPGALSIFGVLTRAELDLRPVVDLLALSLCAYLVPVALSPRLVRLPWLLGAIVVVLGSPVLTWQEGRALNDQIATLRSIDKAPLGRIALAVLRRATDRDHDGASALFGGGDCDDHDPTRSPLAVDIPGNGIDEDCSGADTPAPRPAQPPPPLSPEERVPKGLNLILVTVDTLRPDLGFMGWSKPTSPNLDALAARGVVFDDMHSMASYTGKSVGPLLIGKYPSETARDGAHFDTYLASNVLVTERLHAAGIRTIGAAAHWYFSPWSGLSQGMDVWDMSAKPGNGQGESDTSVTSAQLSDAALRLLGDAANTGDKRFFMWVHYFDPHAQYMPHAGAPAMGGDGVGPIRALYDGEVWFTDHQLGRVLDYVQSQPWGKRTAIIVTSDHGEAFGEHHMSWHGFEIWECLTHVPFLVYVPGATPHHVPEKRSQIDLVPTILDLMGIDRPPPGELSGQSLVDDVLGKGPFPERDVYIDMPDGPYTHMRKAILTGPTPGMKLIYAGGKNYQLYDLKSDPGEENDLSGDGDRMKPVLDAFNAMRARVKEIYVKPKEP